MDDYGNSYQTEAWAYGCEQWGYSMNTFGMFDDAALDICLHYCIDWIAQDI